MKVSLKIHDSFGQRETKCPAVLCTTWDESPNLGPPLSLYGISGRAIRLSSDLSELEAKVVCC